MKLALSSFVVALLFNAGLAAAADPAKKTITVGTTAGPFGDMVKASIAPQLEKKGYTVKLVEFSDYVRPNLALNEGSLDFNVFQTAPYLKAFSEQHKLNLKPIFQVPTPPLGIYPGKSKALTQVKEGTIFAASNVTTDFARALTMLQDLGWITLKPGTNPLTASQKDIATNVKKIKIIQLEAAQLPRSRQDVDFAVINGNYAISSGIPLTEKLYTEKSFAYINWGVIKAENANKPWVKDVIEVYNSPEFKAYTAKKFVGYKLPLNWK
jgi:D-methionine transport system substrate-binding protein